MAAGGLDVFVGRESELATLVAAVDRAGRSGPAAVLVAGEAGIGKTRLVDEVAAAARKNGARVLRGDATEGDRSPFGLWAGIERALGLGVSTDDALPASERRWEVLEAIEAGLRGVGRAVVVLEDAHWADEGSRWVLERLPRQLADAPVAIVATSRLGEPGADELGGYRRQSTTVELTGLDEAAVGALAARVRPGMAVDAEGLRARTGGNPLFVHELLVTAEDGGVPPVVAGVLERSLDRLEPDALAVVGVLALAGAHTPVAVLAGACGLAPREVQDRLDAAVASGVLRRTGRGVGFRHVLLAEAARARLSSAVRSDLHVRLADAWTAADRGPAGAAEAAAHRVAALPGGDVELAAATVLDAVTALRATGDERRIADLAGTALEALDHGGGSRPVRTTIALARASALEAVGAEQAAVAAYAVAADLARGGDDVEQRAVAEIGAAAAANPFLPHVEQLARLREVEAALPPGDSPLRVGLLRRSAVLQCSSPGGPREALAEGDEAVAMARRLGDPESLVAALSDRNFVPLGPEGLDARAAAATEIVALGEQLHRPDIALRGYEWTFAHRLDGGDLGGAQLALERLDAYSQVMPSPWWRWAAELRRVVVTSLLGDHPGTMRAIDRAAALGPLAAEPGEALGLEQSNRTGTMLLWGIHDPLAPPLHEQVVVMASLIPAPFIQVMLALDKWALGDLVSAAAIADRYAGQAQSLLDGVEGSDMVAFLAALVAEVGLVHHAPGLRAALAPYAGRLGSGNGSVVLLPIDAVLGRLALLEGDVDAAVRHLHAAVAFAERLPSPTLIARSTAYLADALDAAGDVAAAASNWERATAEADRIGLRLPPGGRAGAGAGTPAPAPVSSAQPAGSTSTLRRVAAGWEVHTPHGTGRVPDSAGMGQLARLLARPGIELAATDLAGLDASPVAAATDLGPMLDASAKRAYRRRISELQADIDEAEANNDPDRATLAQLELDALLTELSRAVGLGGRDRPSGSDAERARVNVTRSLKRAIAAVTQAVPDLGAHLDRSVRTGRFCAYAPEPAAALTWEIVAEPGE